MNRITQYSKPLAIYIHWPFCLKKCPYCDFNSHVREEVEQSRWKSALLRELDWTAEKISNTPYHAVSIFFGGGTPSLMPADTVAAIIEKVQKLWGEKKTEKRDNENHNNKEYKSQLLKTIEQSKRPSTLSCGGLSRKPAWHLNANNNKKHKIEITLEANPTSSESQKFKDFRDAGINRLSLGVQSLRDDALLKLGREHSAKEALTAVELAADIFPRYSFDLIYARPEQSLKGWETELREALTYADGHLSLYQLTIENGTAFKHLHEQGKLIIPEDDLAADFYQLTEDILSEQQLYAYEISNYSKEGQESRHNLAYWQGESYIGIGAGAHGRLNINKFLSTQNIKSPERWLSQVEAKGNGIEECLEIPPKDRAEEAILSGLRLTKGINKTFFKQQTGISLDSLIQPNGLSKMQQIGMVKNTESNICLTKKGLLLLDSVAAELLI